jgi:hypothetical protein
MPKSSSLVPIDRRRRRLQVLRSPQNARIRRAILRGEGL